MLRHSCTKHEMHLKVLDSFFLQIQCFGVYTCIIASKQPDQPSGGVITSEQLLMLEGHYQQSELCQVAWSRANSQTATTRICSNFIDPAILAGCLVLHCSSLSLSAQQWLNMKSVQHHPQSRMSDWHCCLSTQYAKALSPIYMAASTEVWSIGYVLHNQFW